MAKKKLIEEIKVNPARYYRMPADVIRDRRFTDEERMEILEAWERDARGMSVAEDEGLKTTDAGQPTHLKQIVDARLELEKKVPGEHNYREASKFGGGSVE